MLQYSLVNNPLTPNPTDLRAIIQQYKRKKIADIVKQLTVPGSILKETECEAVIKRFLQIIADNLQEGIGLDSEFLIISQTISGVFNHENDPFDRSRHQVNMTVRPGAAFQQALDQAKPIKTDNHIPTPAIKSVFDVKTKSNEQLTADRMFDIYGSQLKIENAEDPAQGVFLVSTQKEKEVKVEYIHHNGYRKLQVELPAGLKTGEKYRLEIRTTVNGGKEIRTGSYHKVLSVA